MNALDLLSAAGGLALLVIGGDLLVRGASGLAARVGLSTLVIGLTVVSLATSAPELAVTLDAVVRDQAGLAVGNVVGSNIALVLLVLGASAVVTPLRVQAQLVRMDVPTLVVVSVATLLLALDGGVSRLDGTILVVAAVGYVLLVLVVSRREVPVASADAASDGADARTPAWLQTLLVVAGVALLVLGAQLLVGGAVGIADAFGVSGLVLGLTVVAVGTSLPELVTSIVAAARGERDLAVGNIVGSGIFNICVVLGVAGLVAPDGVPVAPAALALDLPLMIASAVVLLPIAFTGLAVERWEGALFVVLYAAYTAYVLLEATEHDALEGFEAVMVWFALPLLVLMLVAVTSYELGRRRAAAGGLSGPGSG